jgi:hypothetical protein
MKKMNYFLAAVGAIMMATSCTNDEFTGESSGTTSQTKEESPILFSGGASNLTRADLYGEAAATKLGNKFVVYGTKHFAAEDKTATNDAIAFKNFQVEWTANTAGTTESNSSDWEYVGKTAYDVISSAQTIKYWDYNANNGYTFTAFSYHRNDTEDGISYPANSTDDDVSVVKTTADESSLYNKGYKVTVKQGATLNNLYFSDRVPVEEEDYDKTVTFTFRNIGARVRFGFYETVPGYTVKIDNFYIDDANSAVVTDFATMNDAKTDGFYASLQNVKTAVDQTINVTYYESTTATQVINRPKVSNPSAGYNYYLKLGNSTGLINTVLGTSSSSPTWTDGTTGAYTPVFPFEGNTNPLLLKLDFTLTADDGSGDEIQVRGARAIVPAEYVKWKSNFAYTYLFKISDKTNGTTGAVDANGDPIDPEGLKPITFDAIAVDVTEELQQTITSVSTNSITTYADGAIVNEYNAGKPIYVVTTDNSTHSVITPSAIGIGAGQARVYKVDKATTEASVLAKLSGSPIDITLTPLTPLPTVENTLPLADGTTPSISNVKFTPSAAGYYAYVYTTTAYVAPEYEAVTTGGYNSGTTYYMLSGSGAYYAVSVPNSAAYEENLAKLYKVKEGKAGTAGVYDVKVIKVQ